MGLRKQLREIANRWFSVAFVEAAGLPRAIDAMAVKAFREQTPDNQDTRALRRGLDLLHGSPGWITDEEPEVYYSPEIGILDEF